MLSLSIVKALQIYGIAAAISFLVAVIIKALVEITARLEKRTHRAAPAPRPPAAADAPPAAAGIPDDVVPSSPPPSPPWDRTASCTSRRAAAPGAARGAPPSIRISRNAKNHGVRSCKDCSR